MKQAPGPWQWKFERDPGGHWARASILDANGRVILQGAPGIAADELEAIVRMAAAGPSLLEALARVIDKQSRDGYEDPETTLPAYALIRQVAGEVSSSSTPSDSLA